MSLKADNGHYVLMKRNGQLSASSTDVVEDSKFVFEFINRPTLILRCENGFVGQKTASPQLECTRYVQYTLVNTNTRGPSKSIRLIRNSY